MRFAMLAIALASCAPAPTTSTAGGPRGPRASDHLQAAQQDDTNARNAVVWPETTTGGMDRADQMVPLPWFRSWDGGVEQARLAEIHRGEAAEIQADYERTCGTRSSADVAISPLVRYSIGGWPTQTGAILYLSSDAGPPAALLAAFACHRAWMMLAPSDMDECPLDLPDVIIDARGDAAGITVSLGVKNAANIPELQRRVALELEARSHRAHAPAKK